MARDPSRLQAVKLRSQWARVVFASPREIKRAMAEVDGFNAKAAVLITRSVGTMWCAYLFTALALVSVRSALKTGDLVIIVAWISQTFFQLVLLPVIIVGQNVQGEASEARAQKTFEDTETIIDRLDTHTKGGITTILDRIDELEAKITTKRP
jgi:hypothetical protein